MDLGKRNVLKWGSASIVGLWFGERSTQAQGKRVAMTPEQLMLSLLSLSKKARQDGFGEVANGLLELVDKVIHQR